MVVSGRGSTRNIHLNLLFNTDEKMKIKLKKTEGLFSTVWTATTYNRKLKRGYACHSNDKTTAIVGLILETK